MSARKLKTVFRPLGHTQPLTDGTVKPRTFEIDYENVEPLIQAFRRMVRGLEFDICEMALTTYLCAKAHGKRFTAIPVFPARAFHHGAIIYNIRSGIKHPKDLEGKRVWARSILQHQYGVDLNKITWVLSGDEHVAEYRPPANVVPVAKGKKLEDMVTSGEVPAAVNMEVNHPDVKALIANAREAGFEALRRHGHYPINHTVVIKDELLATQPDLAADIFNVFTEAKRIYVERLKNKQIAQPSKTDETYARVLEITRADPLAYGIAPNRKMIEAITQYAAEQKIVPRRFTVEELFARNTLALVG